LEDKIVLNDNREALLLFGRHDENLKLIEENSPAQILARGNELILKGAEKEVRETKKLFEELLASLRAGHIIRTPEIKYALKMAKEGELDLKKAFFEKIGVSAKRRAVIPRSLGQKKYVDSIRKNDIVMAIGPAGTGKTYLAMALAVSFLLEKKVNRIILTRPAVEAGEKLGFLPGNLYEKVDPYLRPLYDALYDMMEVEKVKGLMDQGIIEVAPLAFMRGRTLNDSFIILDEAQNTSREQMKMFLTRLGIDSKAVVTGDITQIDLSEGQVSGLVEIQSVLKEIKGIDFIYFSDNDVVRHQLVQEIVRAYEGFEKNGR
jgi:phosphate starvation-inducible PhoH-like protein